VDSCKCFSQESPSLIDIIKNDYLVAPDNLEYNFTVPVEELLHGEVGQPLDVDNIVFKGKLKNGFFVEAGSHNSEKNSDSLYFEVIHGWTGLLVEPHPLTYVEGREKHRKATTIQTCLSTRTKPEMVHFDLFGSVRNSTSRESMSGIVPESRGNDTVEMQCLPLYSILMAMDNPTVHYFSLDIEGAEFAVLKTIPWDLVDIQVLSVETHLAGRIFPGNRQDMINYMDQVGYRHVEGAHSGTNQGRKNMGTIDDMFVKKGIPIRDEL